MRRLNEIETVSTLRFGAWAKKIKNKPKINKDSSVEELKAQLAKAESIIRAQEIKIKVLEKIIIDMGGNVPEIEEQLKILKSLPSKEEEENVKLDQDSSSS